MKVSVIRHWEVDYKWSAWCTSDEFDRDCMGYNEAPIKHMSCSLPDKEYQKVYVSTLSRSRNTAIELFGNRLFHKTDLIDEVPLKSGFDTGKKLPLWFWNISGRFQWFINSPRQTEGRFCTRKRAEQFVAILCKEGGDCAVVTHGFYIHTLLREMKKAGFRIKKEYRVNYKNGECVIAER